MVGEVINNKRENNQYISISIPRKSQPIAHEHASRLVFLAHAAGFAVRVMSMEKRERGTGSRRQKGRRREPEKGPSLSAWLRCYAKRPRRQ